MKKVIILILALSLLLAGCGNAASEAEGTTAPETTVPETTVPETTVPETTEETEPETTAETEPPAPDTAAFTVQTDRAPAVLQLLNRGDTVEVVGEYEGYHVIRTEQGYGMVEKGLLRFDGEAGYEGWTGYAYYGAELKGSYQLTGEVLQTLTMNTKVEVLEELPHCYMVQLGDAIGFVAKEGLSRNYIRSGGGNSGGQDGGDISMGIIGGIDLLGYTVPQEGEVTGTATVLCDGAQVLLGWFDREEIAQVITEEGFAPAWDGWYSVYLNGFCVYIPQGLLWDPDTEGFAQWDGYSAYNTEVFDNYLCLGEPTRTLTINTVATILWDTGDSVVISIDGEIFYADAADFSLTRRTTGGGNSGGDWTPPAM